MAKKKNESNRARKVRRAVVGKFKIDNKPKKSGSNKKSGAKKSTTTATTATTTPKKSGGTKKGGDGSKKGTKREGRFKGMTTSDIREFREQKRNKNLNDTVTPEPAELDPTETQLPLDPVETSEPAFDYEGALADMKAEFAEQRRIDEENYSRQLAKFEQGERTQMENQARSGQQAEYKLGSPSERMRGGTFGFRRRKRRLMGGIGAVNSLAAGAAGGMLNF